MNFPLHSEFLTVLEIQFPTNCWNILEVLCNEEKVGGYNGLFWWFLTGSWLISVRALSILSSALFSLALVAIITRVIGGCVCTQVLNKTKCQTHALLVFLAGKSKYDFNYNFVPIRRQIQRGPKGLIPAAGPYILTPSKFIIRIILWAYVIRSNPGSVDGRYNYDFLLELSHRSSHYVHCLCINSNSKSIL